MVSYFIIFLWPWFCWLDGKDFKQSTFFNICSNYSIKCISKRIQTWKNYYRSFYMQLWVDEHYIEDRMAAQEKAKKENPPSLAW